MRRYAGEDLPVGCRIAVVANDALGTMWSPISAAPNAPQEMASINAARLPGTRTEELWMEDAKIHWGFPLDGSEPHFAVLNAFPRRRARSRTISLSIWRTRPGQGVRFHDRSNEHLHLRSLRGRRWEGRFAFRNGWPGGGSGPTRSGFRDPPLKYPFLKSGFIGEIFCRLAYMEAKYRPRSPSAGS